MERRVHRVKFPPWKQRQPLTWTLRHRKIAKSPTPEISQEYKIQMRMVGLYILIQTQSVTPETARVKGIVNTINVYVIFGMEI